MRIDREPVAHTEVRHIKHRIASKVRKFEIRLSEALDMV